MPTIGVSIAVPEPYGEQLREHRLRLGDEAARLIPTHITLVSPYDVPEGALPTVDEHLSAVAETKKPFDVHLRGTGTFRPTSAVVFVGVVEGISDCERLAAALRSGPLATEAQFPYHPHVTVAHNVPEPALDAAFEELAGFDARFEVSDFWLYVHDAEAGWLPVRSYPLSTC